MDFLFTVTGHLRPRPQTPDLQLRFRRVPPIFAPAQWNIHEVTLANQPRTNNVSEGWNNKFRNLVGQSHPTVWKLIECLQAECARVSAVLLQDERGVRPKKLNCVKCYYIIVIKCGKGCTINVVITVVLFACLIIENLIQKYIWPKRPPSKMAEPKRPWPKRPSPKRPWPKRPWPKRPTFDLYSVESDVKPQINKNK